MATNPKIPYQPERQDIHKVEAQTQLEPPRSVWRGVIMAIAVAAILIGVFVFKKPVAQKVSPTPSKAIVSDQSTGNAIQIQSLQMAPPPLDGNSLVLQGQLINAGQQPLTGINMNVTFKGQDGRVLLAAAYPIEILDVSERGSTAKVTNSQPTGVEPSKPNDVHPFRMKMDRVPKGWNHQMPDVSITEITSHP